MIKKEEFLAEHNKLSPPNLQATLAMLNRFKEEKKPLLADNGWSIEKIRIPFILWILALKPEEHEKERKSRAKTQFKNYPETHIS